MRVSHDCISRRPYWKYLLTAGGGKSQVQKCWFPGYRTHYHGTLHDWKQNVLMKVISRELNGWVIETSRQRLMTMGRGGGGRGASCTPGLSATPLIRGSHIRDVRGEDSTKRERKKKDREGGGGLRKLRLRSQILSHSLFTAPHVEVWERKGRNKKSTRGRRRRGAAERPWQYPQRLSPRQCPIPAHL